MAADGGQNNLDFATAVTDRVTVGRSLTAESHGLIATYTLATNGETERAVTVEVRDFLPNWGIEEIGFHPDFEPDEGSITENKVAFRSEVPPDDTLVVKYGVTLSTSEPVEVVARQQSLNPPRVTEGDGGEEGSGAETPSMEPLAPPADGEPDADDGSLVFDDGAAADDDREAPTEGPDLDTTAGDGEPSPDTAEPSPRVDEPPLEASSTPDDVDEPPALDASPGDDDASLGGTSSADDGPSFDGDTADGNVVDALLAEIQRGAVSDAQLAALREVLGTGTPTSVDVRLRHVHARMEEFAAYADALQSLLDGGDVEGVADLRGEVDELRSAFEALSEEQRAAAERIDALEATVEDLESAVTSGMANLSDGVDAAASGEGPTAEEVAEIRNAVNVLAQDVEDRFEDLWATIDAVNRAGETAPADAIN